MPFSLFVTYGSNNRERSCVGKPIPLSSIIISRSFFFWSIDILISGLKVIFGCDFILLSMASPAFLIKLVNAWFIIVSSILALKSLYGFSKLILTFGEETSKSNITSFNNLVMFVGRLIGSGILANLENSSTILRKSFV